MVIYINGCYNYFLKKWEVNFYVFIKVRVLEIQWKS